MTLSDLFLTLVAFPFCFVIQLVTIDKVVSNNLISGDDLVSNKPIAGRGVVLTDTPISNEVISGDGVVLTYPVSSG